MRYYAAVIYLFLYAPIALIVLFSFNSGRHASEFRGFSIEWYGAAFSNRWVMEALTTSLIVAGTTAVLATVMGTSAAARCSSSATPWSICSCNRATGHTARRSR